MWVVFFWGGGSAIQLCCGNPVNTLKALQPPSHACGSSEGHIRAPWSLFILSTYTLIRDPPPHPPCARTCTDITVLYCTPSHSFLQLLPVSSSVLPAMLSVGLRGVRGSSFVRAYAMHYPIVQSSQWDRGFDLGGVHLSSLSSLPSHLSAL